MKTEVLEYIKKYEMLRKGDTVVIGVSGGPDSVCLLVLLKELSYQLDINIEVVHVNHMLRPEAGDEADFVKALCNRMGLTFHLFKEDVMLLSKREGLSTEEAGRKIRYDALRKVLDGRQGKIAVAHNQNDLAETVVFNLLRGSSIKGLCGIEPVNGDIIRPLLCMSRERIIEFLEKNRIEYVTDKSNLTDEYTRNKIRHHIIEYSDENVVKGCVSNIASAAERMREADSFIRKQTVRAAARCGIEDGEDILINTDALLKEDPFIAKCVIYEMIGMTAGLKKDITSAHVGIVYDLLFTEGSKELSLPYGILVRKEYNRLCFIKKGEDDDDLEEGEYEGDANTPGRTRELPQINHRILTDFDIENIPTGNYTKWFDCDKISKACTLRYRRKCDYLTINSEMGKKSLQEYMVNEKIPKRDRDRVPLVADGSHIMWVVGHRMSEYYKVTKDTMKVLEVTVRI